MPRALVRLTTAPDAPPLLTELPEGTVLAPFGRWLRERIASMVPDWPAIAFHRIECIDDGVEVLLIAGPRLRSAHSFAAVVEAIRLDTARGARRCGWTRGELWQRTELVSEEPSEADRFRPAAAATSSSSPARRSRPESRRR